MKFALVALSFCAVCAAADTPAKASQKASAKNSPGKIAAKTKPQPVKVQALTIPDGATKLDDSTYVMTDAAGKTWLYQKTPFGISKVEKSQAAEAATKADNAPAKAADATPFGKTGPATTAAVSMKEEGDSIRFVRSTPFGKQTWVRKKSELSEDERALWEKQRTQ